VSAREAAEARAYCRHVLPEVSRTFAINIEMLDGGLRDTVRVAYLLCRAADALEDSWPGPPADIEARFARFVTALEGGDASSLAQEAARRGGEGADLRLVANLPLVLAALEQRPAAERAIVREAVRVMAAGMSRYSARAAGRPAGACYLDDEKELSDYCWVVAGCVGVMLTQLLELRLQAADDSPRERRRALAPVVGEALQLTNILLDLPHDLRRGRCYLPASWLAAHGLSPADLLGAPTPVAKETALRLAPLAHAALDRVPDYLDALPRGHLRYRLFCLWPALWARASLRLVERDAAFPFGPRRPRLTRAQLWGAAVRSLFVAHDPRGVRRMLAGG
jgi:farnesyl-diphosphate farnesyltransferase